MDHKTRSIEIMRMTVVGARVHPRTCDFVVDGCGRNQVVKGKSELIVK